METKENVQINPKSTMNYLVDRITELCGDCQRLATECSELAKENTELRRGLSIVSIIISKHFDGLTPEAREEIQKCIEEVVDVRD